MKLSRPRLTLLAVILLGLSACDKSTPSSQQSGQGPLPEVTVQPAQAETLPLQRELVGRLASTRVAEVRARVAGIILHRAFTEGSDVEKGQLLFQIDPAPLQAELSASEAALARAEADAANAALIARRYQKVANKGVVSTQDLDTALANERTAKAVVKQEQANVERARLDLGYATVTAPISGYAGRAMVTEGALVGEDGATRLTTIEQIDPIYVNFSQPINNLQQLQQLVRDRKAGDDTGKRVKVEVILPDGTAYPHYGAIDFSGVAVDPQTGAVSLRATIPNHDRSLLPGMFVELRVTVGQLENAFLLPHSAVLRDSAGAYLYVVNASGEVEQRRVKSHAMQQGDWVITGDLATGEQVVTAGLQKVKPGGKARAVIAGADDKPSAAGTH